MEIVIRIITTRVARIRFKMCFIMKHHLRTQLWEAEAHKKMIIPAKTIIQAKSLGMAKPLTGAAVSDIPLSIKFS